MFAVDVPELGSDGSDGAARRVAEALRTYTMSVVRPGILIESSRRSRREPRPVAHRPQFSAGGVATRLPLRARSARSSKRGSAAGCLQRGLISSRYAYAGSQGGVCGPRMPPWATYSACASSRLRVRSGLRERRHCRDRPGRRLPICTPDRCRTDPGRAASRARPCSRSELWWS